MKFSSDQQTSIKCFDIAGTVILTQIFFLLFFFLFFSQNSDNIENLNCPM